MSNDTYIRIISDRVPNYTRNFNEIVTNEYLYEGGRPSDADPADYSYGKRGVNAVARSGVRIG